VVGLAGDAEGVVGVERKKRDTDQRGNLPGGVERCWGEGNKRGESKGIAVDTVSAFRKREKKALLDRQARRKAMLGFLFRGAEANKKGWKKKEEWKRAYLGTQPLNLRIL